MMKIINDTYKGSVRYVVAQTEGVCSQAIELLVEGDVILDAAFHGGCNGNLKGIVALCKGEDFRGATETHRYNLWRQKYFMSGSVCTTAQVYLPLISRHSCDAICTHKSTLHILDDSGQKSRRLGRSRQEVLHKVTLIIRRET